jgi:hypothetical protein
MLRYVHVPNACADLGYRREEVWIGELSCSLTLSFVLLLRIWELETGWEHGHPIWHGREWKWHGRHGCIAAGSWSVDSIHTIILVVVVLSR